MVGGQDQRSTLGDLKPLGFCEAAVPPMSSQRLQRVKTEHENQGLSQHGSYQPVHATTYFGDIPCMTGPVRLNAVML